MRSEVRFGEKMINRVEGDAGERVSASGEIHAAATMLVTFYFFRNLFEPRQELKSLNFIDCSAICQCFDNFSLIF